MDTSHFITTQALGLPGPAASPTPATGRPPGAAAHSGHIPIARMRRVFQSTDVERRLAKLQSHGSERDHEQLRATSASMLERGPDRFAV